MEFPDNRLAAALYGAHDRHLAVLEDMLGVRLINRGNRLLIQGSPAMREAAANILEALHERLARGESIDIGDIEGAVRLVQHPRALAGADSDNAKGKTGGAITQPAQASGEPPARLRIFTRRRVISPRSPNQVAYIEAMRAHPLTFGVGPAGTGKTYLAVMMAVEALLAGEVDRIILSRPAVEAGERLGFLPGDLREKVDPYLRPLYDALYDALPADQVERRLMSGEIEIAPLAYMRGRTLAHAWVILDEAQNTTPMQMKMFLTRFGEGAHVTICGDPSQVDLPGRDGSGLHQALRLLNGVEGIAIVQFDQQDVVRHPLVARIIAAYENDGRSHA
ncbi:MAG: PhoH family protein [Alphaproteobacteria bacterium]|nr:MAG: PhoH family protein [Alphaproteobacteria bacterium]